MNDGIMAFFGKVRKEIDAEIIAHRSTQYLVALAIQLVLVGYIFSDIFFTPLSYMLFNQFDGLKNYYTLITYILQDASVGYGYYGYMNYPIGDYIVFTDNTPILAAAMRFWHLNIFSLDGIIVSIFNFVMLFNFVLAFLLSFAIGRNLKMRFGVSLLLAFVLSWFSSMSISVVTGVSNLSLTSLILANILLVIKLYGYIMNGDKRKIFTIYFCLFLLLVVSAFSHIYYLAIEGIFTGIFLIGSLLVFRKDRKALLVILGAFVVLIIATATIMLILQLTDPFYAIRPKKADGYGWDPWVMNLSGIFKGFPFLQLSMFKRQMWNESGKFGFMGHFSIIMFLLWGLRFFIKKVFKKAIFVTEQDDSFSRIVKLVLIAGVINLFTSIGNSIYVFNWFKFDNIFSPFFFARKFLSQVEHFRFLTRLQWPFFFAINIWAFYQFDRLLRSNMRKSIKYVILFIGVAAIAVDGYGFLRFYKLTRYKNVLNQEAFSKLPNVDGGKYQAILSIPYFQIGNENYDYTIDDDIHWSLYNFQLAIKENLPLIACKMSRIPLEHSMALYSIFTEQQMSNKVKEKLNDKPILVIYNGKVKTPGKRSDFTANIIKRGPEIIQEKNMKFLFEKDGVKYYEWSLN